MSDPDDSDDADVYHAEFDISGECTCEHDADDHGWDGCTIEGCKCEASWVE